MAPVTSYDTAGSYLLLGGNNGSIYYISRWGEALKRALKSVLFLLSYDGVKGCWLFTGLKRNVKLKTIVDY